jgi:MFS family permease
MCSFLVFACLNETVKNPTPLSILLGIKKQNLLPDSASTKTLVEESEKPLPLRQLLTPRVIIAAGNYAFLSIVDISFRAIHPVFLATPATLGGLDLPPSTIGLLLSVSGVVNAVFQLLFFTKIINKWGPKKAYVVGISSTFVSFALFPILTVLVKNQGLSLLVWFLITVQLVVQMGMNLPYGMFRVQAR